jgi:hypothetical protein
MCCSEILGDWQSVSGEVPDTRVLTFNRKTTRIHSNWPILFTSAKHNETKDRREIAIQRPVDLVGLHITISGLQQCNPCA